MGSMAPQPSILPCRNKAKKTAAAENSRSTGNSASQSGAGQSGYSGAGVSGAGVSGVYSDWGKVWETFCVLLVQMNSCPKARRDRIALCRDTNLSFRFKSKKSTWIWLNFSGVLRGPEAVSSRDMEADREVDAACFIDQMNASRFLLCWTQREDVSTKPHCHIAIRMEFGRCTKDPYTISETQSFISWKGMKLRWRPVV